MTKEILKIGILLDADQTPFWAYHAIEKIVLSQTATIDVVIKKSPAYPKQSKIARIWNMRKHLGYCIYNSISKFLFRGKPNAFLMKSTKKLFLNIPTVNIQPIQKKHTDCFKASDIEDIKKYDLDLIIKMGFRTLSGDILTSCSKFGVWSYHHGENHLNRGGPPGYWETVQAWPTTGSILHILSEEPDGGNIVYRSWTLTNALSLTANRNAYFWTSATFLSRQIERLYQVGADIFFKEIEQYNSHDNFYSNKQLSTPTNLSVLKHSVIMSGRLINRVWQKIFYLDQWTLFFKIDQGMSQSFHRFKEIKPPKDRFWADPHVVKKDGIFYVFVEEYLYKTKLGRLAVIEIDQQGNVGHVKTVMEKDYHLSYPNVFELDGIYYMIPETSANRTIDIYECVDFPTGWQFKMSLMQDIDAVDTTILFKDNKWWLFANIAQNKGASKNDELFLYYADELFTTDWIAHPQNPIISDTTKSRPAGKIIEDNGKLFRPSQDCSGIYGRGFNLSEITQITEDAYEEKITSTIYPDWDNSLLGTHCINTEGGLTVIDAFRRVRKLF